MRIAKSDVTERINIPGAVARQALEFGDASGYGQMAGEYFSLAAGVDLAPLLQGLEGDLCPSPHWGYMLEGELTVTYGDASQEVIQGGDLFYWRPGHTLAVTQNAEIVLFSPQHEHCAVVAHVRQRLLG
jgi:hypothetical protein